MLTAHRAVGSGGGWQSLQSTAGLTDGHAVLGNHLHDVVDTAAAVGGLPCLQAASQHWHTDGGFGGGGGGCLAGGAGGGYTG